MSGSTEALGLARGEVRDGVAAIEHFLQVLASRRVGSKALARSVPEMAAGCAPLAAALHALAEALAEVIAADQEGVAAVRGLSSHAVARVAELAAALAQPKGPSLEARERLALEAVVGRIAGELTTVVRLVEMVGGPVTSETTSIDFTDALHARRVVARKGERIIAAPVEIRASELVVGDVRIVMDLLAQAVLIVARATRAAPRIVVERGPDGFPQFTVGAARQGGNVAVDTARLTFQAVAREELPHERGVTLAAARHAGMTMEVAEDGHEVTLAL